MKDNKDVAFLITAYDQIREIKFTVHMLRTMWKSTVKSPIVIVISGDANRDLSFDHDPYTRLVHIDDMVGDRFKTRVSISIMRQLEHGMLEIKDLEREYGEIRDIVHLHGDVLLLDEDGFFNELENWRATEKPLAADSVGEQGVVCKTLEGHEYKWRFFGTELMPQLFVVDHAFCKYTGFLYHMEAVGDLEIKATEWALIGNLHRCTHSYGNGHAFRPVIDVEKDEDSPYRSCYDEYIHVIRHGRSQWDLHSHWGGFCHYGNSLHFSKRQREARNEMALRRYNVDLSKW